MHICSILQLLVTSIGTAWLGTKEIQYLHSKSIYFLHLLSDRLIFKFKFINIKKNILVKLQIWLRVMIIIVLKFFRNI